MFDQTSYVETLSTIMGWTIFLSAIAGECGLIVLAINRRVRRVR